MLQKQRIWDLPTRIFHWTFAISVVLSMLIVYGKKYLALHIIVGTFAFALLLGRFIWGLTGTKYVRFSSFVKSKDEIKREFSIISGSKDSHIVGHPPIAGFVMLFMMFCGLSIGISGLLLYFWADEKTKEALFDFHEMAANTLLVIAFIHIQGVFMHMFLHHDGIIMGMVNGKRPAYKNEQISDLTIFQKLVAILWFSASLSCIIFYLYKAV